MIRVLDSRVWIRTVRTRMPFRFGIATMTVLPHVLLEATVDVDGSRASGWAADHLPPKWFTKNPSTDFTDDVADMLEVIDHARVQAGEAASAAALAIAPHPSHPALLANFGVSMIERAVIDAVCRASGTAFHDAVRSGVLGVRCDVAAPAASVALRHTVGLSDPIDERLPDSPDDGLPVTLAECIESYGLTHFKIKVTPDADLERLKRIFATLPPGAKFTLDGNESFTDVDTFRAYFQSIPRDGLLFVEQPFHRDITLGTDLRVWDDRPPIIIDESDTGPAAVQRALDLGYAGTSHKNCKGVFAGLAKWSMHPPVLSGEDLTTIGPVSLLADLAVMAALGVTHVERNGHHYFRGVEVMQDDLAAAHPDLYTRLSDGTPALRVTDGRIALESVNAAPFGVGFEPSTDGFTPAAEWSVASLKG